MAIEFRCTKCNKLLRTADDTAGKHAKCPQCGTILVIPAGGMPMGGPMPSAGPAPFAGGGAGGYPPPGGPTSANPFGAGDPPPYQPDTGNPYQSPAAYSAMPPAAMGDGQIRPSRIAFGDVFSTVWAVYSRQWLAAFVGVLILGVCYIIGAFGLMIVPVMIGAMTREPVIVFGCLGVGYLMVLFFVSFLVAGGIRYFLNLARGENMPLGDLFSGGPHLLSIFLFLLFNVVIGIVLYLVCIVPGMATQSGVLLGIGFVIHYIVAIYIGILFSQGSFLIVDRTLGVVEGISRSVELMRGNKLIYFLILFVVMFCLGVPLLAAYGGIFASIGFGGKPAIVPIIFIGLFMFAWYLFSITVFATLSSVVYLKITGQPTLDQMRGQMYMQ